MKIITPRLRRPPRSRGVSLMLILLSITFVSIALLATSALFASQSRRSRDLPVSAQHRQLLLAAAQSLLAKLNANETPADFSLPLPPEIHGTTVRITTDSPARYRITAATGKIITCEVLTFEKKSARWTLSDATLSPEVH